MTPKFSLLAVPCAALLATFVACRPAPPPAATRTILIRAEAKKQAVKAYTALVDKYPDSEFASQAQARLSALKPTVAGTSAPQQ